MSETKRDEVHLLREGAAGRRPPQIVPPPSTAPRPSLRPEV